jgi:hypothetical protein
MSVIGMVVGEEHCIEAVHLGVEKLVPQVR